MTLKSFIGSEDERNAFINTDEFAEEGQYTNKEGAGPTAVPGIYSAAWSDLNAKGRAVESYAASFLCLLADLPGTPEEGRINIKGIDFFIKAKVDSEDGFYTTLSLSEDE